MATLPPPPARVTPAPDVHDSIAQHFTSLARRLPLSAEQLTRLDDPLAQLLLRGVVGLEVDTLQIGLCGGWPADANGAVNDAHLAKGAWIFYVASGREPLAVLSVADRVGPGLAALRDHVRAFATVEEQE